MGGDVEMRRRLLALIRRYPGLHVREAARQLDTSVALVEYHVPFLLEAGVVEEERDERYQRLYPVGEGHRLTAADRAVVSLLRQPTPFRVTLVLLERGEARHVDLAEVLDVGKSTLSFHLRKMERRGLVEKTGAGSYRLRHPERTSRLLLAHQPTKEMRDDFADLWTNFYDA